MRADIEEAVAFIKGRTERKPNIGIVLGSGLSRLADAVEDADAIYVDEIPSWPLSTVSGHAGRLLIGTLENATVLVLQGRAHFYEGYTMAEITFPVRVMNELGVETLILTNAAGGMNPDYAPGDLMVIRDHINFPGLAGHNPLFGPNDETIGPRFPDMTEAYDAGLRRLAHDVAAGLDYQLQEGVYCYVAGPSFETPAELRFLRNAGGDAVGMSTVPSSVVANHAGMRVLGISTITNMALPDPVPGTEHSHDEVLQTGKEAVPRLIAVISGVVASLAQS